MNEELAVGGIILVLIVVGLFLCNLISSIQCNSIGRATHVNTQYGAFKGCIVEINGQWIPYDRWWSEQK